MNKSEAKLERDTLRLVLIGAPASGKGSQAKRLAKALGLLHLSTGAVIRENMRKGTALGERCRHSMNEARLIPDDVVMNVVAGELAGHRQGYVLDGFPRTLRQANLLGDWLRDRGEVLDAVIELDVSRDELRGRVLSRVVCLDCGHPFRLGGQVFSLDEHCPECGGTLGRRADDTVELFDQRYKEFEQMTVPVIDYYRAAGLLQRVDGSALPDDVFENILRVLAVEPVKS